MRRDVIFDGLGVKFGFAEPVQCGTINVTIENQQEEFLC